MVMQQEPMGSFLSEAIPAGYSAIRDKIRNFPQIPWGRIPQTFRDIRDNQRPMPPVQRALRGALGSIPRIAGLGTAELPRRAHVIPTPMRNPLLLPPVPTPVPTPMPPAAVDMHGNPIPMSELMERQRRNIEDRRSLGTRAAPTPMEEPLRPAVFDLYGNPSPQLPSTLGDYPPKWRGYGSAHPVDIHGNLIPIRRAGPALPSRIPLKQPMLRQSLSAGGETPTPQEIRNISGGVMDLYLDR